MKGLFSLSGLFGLLALLAFSNSVLLAQTESTDAQKMMLYESMKKDQTTAVLLSCCVTSAGHAYAGNWPRGLLFTAGKVGCIVIMSTVGVEEKTTRDYYGETTTIEPTPAYYVSYAGMILLSIWEMVDAANEVKKYNLEIYEQIYQTPASPPKIGFNLTPIEKGGKVTLSYNF